MQRKILHYPPMLVLTLTIFFSLVNNHSFSQPNSWQMKRTLDGAITRHLAVGFNIGTKAYFGTGTNDGYNNYKDFWEYDPATDTWSQKADFAGGPRYAAVGFGIGNKGYVGTGGTPSDTKDFWEYNPTTNTWIRKADFAGPARQVAVGFNIGNKGYIGPGRTNGFGAFYQDFWEYDPASDTWVQKADFGGGGRYASSGFSIGTKGYIGTGTDFTGGGFTYRKDFWEYNQATDAWTQKADFGGGNRELAVGLSIGDKGYIGTGLGANDFWEYSPSANTWTKKADYAGGGRNMAVGFSVGNKGYLMSGTGGGNDLWQYSPSLLPPSTIWAKNLGGAMVGYSNPDISNDPAGNSYIAGGFTGTLTFPTLPLPTTLVSAGDADIFIAKYDPSGNVLWAKRAGGTHSDMAYAIKYDGLGNLYIAGSFVESTIFEGTTITNPLANSYNVLLAKFSAATGDFIWARHGAGDDGYTRQAFDVTVDSNGDPYITGELSGSTTTFGSMSPLSTYGKWWDIFVVKYNSAGVPQWQNAPGSLAAGYYGESGSAIAVDASGNVFITGTFNGSANEPTKFGNIDLVSSGGGGFYELQFFLAKYNPSSGAWEWAVEGGGMANDYSKSISLDTAGNAYVSGFFHGSATFGSTTLTAVGGNDYFVAKYSPAGNMDWIRQPPGIGSSGRNFSKVDANGNLYFAGTFDGTVTVGDQTFTSAGYDNVYVTNWNSDGVFQWAKHIPGSYYSQASSIDVEQNGNINLLEVFASVETLDCTTLTARSYSDLVIAKLGTTNLSLETPVLNPATCSGTNTTLSVAGSPGNGAEWKWYSGSCGGALAGIGNSITINQPQGTVYFVRAEGGCAGSGPCASITINNASPVIQSVVAPIDPVAVNSTINLQVAYAGDNITKATVNWGDGTSVYNISTPATSLTLAHTYNSPGVYTISATLENACGLTSAAYVYQYLVIYDPSAGFVTGGGWINSPAGAYRSEITQGGKAIFGFESKYQRGATVPTGNSEFKFQAGDMNFKSTNYEWLVIAGARAQFKGIGKINGNGFYGFLLTAMDGNLKSPAEPDQFRIKIWDKNNGDRIVYDNQYGSADDANLNTTLGNGSIIIHTNNNGSPNFVDNLQKPAIDDSYEGKLSVSAMPNPSSNYFRLSIKSRDKAEVTVRVTDVLGRVTGLLNGLRSNGIIQFGHNYRPGTYHCEILQGKEKISLKLVKL